MRSGYRELPPPERLRGTVTCVWVRAVGAERSVAVLPDACSDLIWQAGRGAFVAGPDTGPSPVAAPAGSVFVGVRFGPGAGGPALGIPLSELRDRRVDAAELSPALSERLPPELDPAEAGRRLLREVTAPPDRAIVEAARRLGDPRTRVEALAGDLGLSERQLRRRCHAAAGYGPKTLQRVLRFRAFLAADGDDLARRALEAGYADQPHLTRECVRLAGATPAALIGGKT